MALEFNGETRRAICDGCGLVTPAMKVASDDVAAQVLRAAGWLISGSTARCPRCRARPLVAASGSSMRRVAPIFANV